MLRKTKWLFKEATLRLKYMTENDCLFCNIIKGKLATHKVLETKNVLAIYDVNPVAKIHILIIPKKHIESVMTVSDVHANDLVNLFEAAQKIVNDRKLDAFRLAFNGGKYQHVAHLHMHLLAGGKVEWSKL